MTTFAGTSTQTVEYLGQLFQQMRRSNALVRLMGGLGNVKTTTSYEFPIGQFFELPIAGQPMQLEGSAPPVPLTTTVSQTTNVVQIFQEQVSLTYLGMSEHSISGTVPIPQGQVNGPVTDPRSQEFQVQQALKKIQQDMNFSFLNGTFRAPSDPSQSPLGTRGIITAITTNVSDQSGVSGTITAQMYRGYINGLLQEMIQQNGYDISNQFYLFAGPAQFSNVINAFAAASTQFVSPEEKSLGLMVRQIVTLWGSLNLVVDPDVPPNELVIIYSDVIGIVAQPVPGKGILFEEPLTKSGSSEQTQIYGQLGMDHGPEYYHGLLKVPANTVIGD